MKNKEKVIIKEEYQNVLNLVISNWEYSNLTRLQLLLHSICDGIECVRFWEPKHYLNNFQEPVYPDFCTEVDILMDYASELDLEVSPSSDSQYLKFNGFYDYLANIGGAFTISTNLTKGNAYRNLDNGRSYMNTLVSACLSHFMHVGMHNNTVKMMNTERYIIKKGDEYLTNKSHLLFEDMKEYAVVFTSTELALLFMDDHNITASVEVLDPKVLDFWDL